MSTEIDDALDYARRNARAGRPVDGLTASYLFSALDRLIEQHDAALAIHRRTDYGSEGWCCRACVDGREQPIPWPCDTAEALGVTA